jgi:hypothetical protein
MVAELSEAGARARSSEEKAGLKSETAKTVAGERRREHRYPCNDPVEIRIVPGDGSRVAATAIEVSRSGLRIELDTPVVRGTEVQILMSKRLSISGRVRHCRRVGAKYQAGILILEAIDSSKPSEHVSDGQLSSYLAGQGLTLTQAVRVREHLAVCRSCRLRGVDSYSATPEAPGKSS